MQERIAPSDKFSRLHEPNISAFPMTAISRDFGPHSRADFAREWARRYRR
jgi:hypothetical protein